MSITEPSSSPLLLQDPSAPALVLSTAPPEDPPPPYPSARRTRQTRRRRALPEGSEHSHAQVPSDEYDPILTHPGQPPGQPPAHSECLDGPDDVDATETTPLLSPRDPASPRAAAILPPGAVRRRRTLSLTSTLRSSASLAPSFAQTVFSAFHPERDSDLDPECREGGGGDGEHEVLEPEPESPIAREYDQQQRALAADLSGYTHRQAQRAQFQQLSFTQRWRRYFQPLKRRAYYSAVFHLVVLNFPYALAAWLFIFVFTLVRLLPGFYPSRSTSASLTSRPCIPVWHYPPTGRNLHVDGIASGRRLLLHRPLRGTTSRAG